MAVENENSAPPTPQPPTVESQALPQSSNLKRKEIILIVSAIVIVLVVGGLLYHRWQSKKSASPILTSTQKAQYQSDQGKYEAAQKTWQSQLADAKDSEAKLGIYYQQSALAVKFKRYDDAKKYAEQAKSLVPNSPTAYVAFAQLATAQSNKAAARQYWQQAIDHLDPNSPTYDLKKRDYQASLDSLK